MLKCKMLRKYLTKKVKFDSHSLFAILPRTHIEPVDGRVIFLHYHLTGRIRLKDEISLGNLRSL